MSAEHFDFSSKVRYFRRPACGGSGSEDKSGWRLAGCGYDDVFYYDDGVAIKPRGLATKAYELHLV